MRMEQTALSLAPKKRGVHLVTREIVEQLPQIATFEKGVCHLFLQHTSAALSINENADPDVRYDTERFIRHLIPDGWSGFSHRLEGDDDMPAHLKSMIFGAQLSIPIMDGSLALGTWQGIYLIEARVYGGSRHIVATIWGV